ncbi:cache domain-containing protein [Massilia sp. TS11]|uniref:cache domain-containing protein n=1 Tax=Massilia sp. TS11 TaxID=2908003 RepID=UPI001EDC8AC7|nr:cache domain-containing protein [Massilia sp. TS11]MCG2586225.1 cache domain-containing protein [Massilia sp. TS11]
MQRLFTALLAALSFLLLPASAQESRATADEAVAMVQKAIKDMKANGKDAVFSEINNFSPKYKDRDLYVTIMDMNGKVLAHGANKKMQGQNLHDYKDANGKLYVQERLSVAKKSGKGWQDYIFLNPVNKELEPKKMYFEAYEGVIVSAGVYQPKK